ncbi:MAG: radical SAM protein [Firmicutes bacterium]|nr:radical SAM protein [Bacillota bacterium]
MKTSEYVSLSKRIFFKKGAMPLHLTFLVTQKCNAACIHCYLWNKLNKSRREITPDEVEKISSSLDNLPYLIISGGEPYLRDDLPRLAEPFYRNSRSRHITITTNGMETEKIITSTEEILKLCPDASILVYISIDGVGEEHDRIRGVKGIFNKAVNTFKILKSLKEKGRINAGALITAMSSNQEKLSEIYNYIKGKIKPDLIYINLIRGEPRNPELKEIDTKYYFEVCRLAEKDLAGGYLAGYGSFPFSSVPVGINIMTHNMVEKTLKSGKFQIPCYAGILSAVLGSSGEVWACEILDRMIGNLRESNYDFRKIWFSPQAEELRNYIKKTKCYCTHECFLNTNILFNPRFLPEIAARAIAHSIFKKR